MSRTKFCLCCRFEITKCLGIKIICHIFADRTKLVFSKLIRQLLRKSAHTNWFLRFVACVTCSFSNVRLNSTYARKLVPAVYKFAVSADLPVRSEHVCFLTAICSSGYVEWRFDNTANISLQYLSENFWPRVPNFFAESPEIFLRQVWKKLHFFWSSQSKSFPCTRRIQFRRRCKKFLDIQSCRFCFAEGWKSFSCKTT